MSVILPAFLRPGDTIGITCPSGYTSPDRVDYAITVLQEWGFKVRLGATVGAEHHYFSGTDADRAQDLQMMLDDSEIKAILMGRGGYGMSRIIDHLDFTRFIKSPKWICGFSDITLLHSHILAQFNIATLHSPMCGAFTPETKDAKYLVSFRQAITGENTFYPIAPMKQNRIGVAKGILAGGNLALLAHATGSASEVDTEGKILFIEDVGEYLYNIDRMLMQLKRADKLRNLAGLIIGGFTDIQDTERPFGQSITDIILDKVADYDYPICFGFPAGHQEINYTLRFGMMHELSVSPESVRLNISEISHHI